MRSRRPVPREQRCDAWSLPNTYRPAGRCEKRYNLVPVGELLICRHHKAVLERRGWLDLGAGAKIQHTPGARH